jgi:hypothetical protein
MKLLDYTFIVLLGGCLVAAVVSFARIEKYLLAHRLIDPDTSRPEVLNFYRKYVDHSRSRTGRIDTTFWIHVFSAGSFILLGVVYALSRLVPFILSVM